MAVLDDTQVRRAGESAIAPTSYTAQTNPYLQPASCNRLRPVGRRTDRNKERPAGYLRQVPAIGRHEYDLDSSAKHATVRSR